MSKVINFIQARLKTLLYISNDREPAVVGMNEKNSVINWVVGIFEMSNGVFDIFIQNKLEHIQFC